MHQLKASKLALAVCGFSALWSVQAAAQGSDSDAKLEQMQKQIENLQNQVRDMKEEKRQQEAEQKEQAKQLRKQKQKQQEQAAARAEQEEQKPEAEETVEAGPKKKLNIGAGAVADYFIQSSAIDPGQHDAGETNFNHFLLSAEGEYGDLSFAVEHRFSPNNFTHANQYLHYGWAAYDFADHHQIKGGFIPVPFGNIKDVGYQSWWGNLPYYTGMTDTQAAGLNYTYENGPWRADLAAFKNDNLGQDALYAGGPSAYDGYEQVNGGAGRLGYTFDFDNDDMVDVSLSARGGQLDVGDGNGNGVHGHKSGSYGNRWAISAAAMAELGDWTLHGQFVNFRYNIPHGRSNDGEALSDRSVIMQNYGSRSGYMPSRGQMYAFDVGREIPVDWGALESINIYDEYSYIHSDRGGYDAKADGGDGANIGSIHQNTFGVSLVAGPVQVWNEVTVGKNNSLGFLGGQHNKQWQAQYDLTFALYFDGDLIDE